MSATAPTTDAPVVRAAAPASRIVAGLAAAAVVAALVDAGAAALGSLLAGPGAIGLAEPAPVLASVVGVLLGAAGWAAIRRVAARPAAVLRWAVPVALLVTWVPDLLVLAGGATVANAVTLMVMHLVVAGCVVPVLARVLPVT